MEKKELKVSAGTVARTIILALALTNQILQATGHSIIPIENDDIRELVSLIFTVVAAAIGWWKNNSFTQNAIRADELLEDMREVDRRE